MLEVVEVVVGLLSFLSAWRFCVPATIGAGCALWVFFRLENPMSSLISALTVLIVSIWLGYRWQRTADARRQTSNNRWRGP